MDQALLATAVEQAMKGIKSQEMLFSIAMFIIGAAMLLIGGKIFIAMTNKRDDTIKALAEEVKDLNLTVSKVAELQNVDLAATARNRDLLQDAAGHLVRLDTCLSVLKSDISNHAIECRQKVLKP